MKIHKKISIFFVLSLLICIMLSMSACCISHDWLEATCTEPVRCSKCDKVQGEPLGHKWQDADCENPQICVVCSETQGKPLGHKWETIKCTEPRECSVCKEKEDEAPGHQWKDATCTEPKTCTVCKKTKGEPSGHEWEKATCQQPKTCKVCHKTEGTPIDHEWEEANCQTAAKCSLCGTTKGTVGDHLWKEATCETPETCKVCGATRGSARSHNWKSATCTTPKTCSYCGKTEGTAEGHSYGYDNKCYDCGKTDPRVEKILSKCSLSLPSLPDTIREYSYSGDVRSSVKVNGIKYEFEVYDVEEETVILTCRFSGEKLYDSRGSNQSSSCKIGWKLYDGNGHVYQDGTYSSPALAVGETFHYSDEEDLIYNFQAAKAGHFRLEIMDVN